MCSCGKPIQIPSSIQLRKDAGLKPIVPPEEVIERLINAGTIPGNGTCTYCGDETPSLLWVHAECERAFQHRGPGRFWSMVLFIVSAVFTPIRVWVSESHDERLFGRDKVYSLPIYVCEKCKSVPMDTASLKRCMCKVPEYRDLLEKFPNAVVNVTKS